MKKKITIEIPASLHKSFKKKLKGKTIQGTLTKLIKDYKGC